MFCGLKLSHLISKIFSSKEMRGSPTSSKRKAARRQAHSPVTPDSPSQNTRAAKKRRRMDLQKQYNNQEKQLTSQTETTRYQAFDDQFLQIAVLSQSDTSPIQPAAPTLHDHNEDATMIDQDGSAFDYDLPSPCECRLPFASTHNTLLCWSGLDNKDVLMPVIEELPDWHDQVEDVSQCRFCNADTDVDGMELVQKEEEEEEEDKQPLLLQIPLELRQHIFSFVLPAVTGRPYLRHGKEIGWIKGACDVLRVNKQIYQEAISVLYNNTIIEFDVNYKGVLVNATQKTGIWNSPQPTSLPDTGVECELARVRQVVINVPDMLSLEEWQSLQKHQAGIKENGAVELKPHLEKLVDVLANQCKELRHVQVNLRDWDEDVHTAVDILQPLQKLTTLSSSITVYKVGWEYWPVTNFELVKEWQEPLRSREVYKYNLSIKEGTFQITEVERASVAKIPVKEKNDEEDEM